MLIWKVIAANPGITRAEIWEHVEHSIPEGYATRMYVRNALKSTPEPSGVDLSRARGFVLTLALHHMRRARSVTWEGDGRARRYTVAREIDYKGNAETIDETGTKAAEHMAVAEALRTAEKWLARAKPDRLDRNGRRGPVIGPPSRKEYEALLLVVKTVRAKNGAEG
jgi:hypothetical protein